MRVPGINERDPQIIAAAIRQLAEGSTNAIGQNVVTLTPSSSTTVVDEPLCTAAAHIDLCPLTANAAAAQVWVASKGAGAFTLGHASSAQTDRNFSYRVSRP